MNSIRSIQRLNKRELEEGIAPSSSWHTDYRDTAFINIGGLPFELSEGDIITIFSQFGEPVWIKLARDKETGKSRGFAWLKYEDQRSCDLAVDNMGGAIVMERVLRVDHARYKPREDEDMRDNTMGEADEIAGHRERSRRRHSASNSDSDSEDDRPLLPEEIDLERALQDLDEEDPMKDSMVKSLKEKSEKALLKYKKDQRKAKEREKRHARRQQQDGHTGHDLDSRRDRRERRVREAPEDDDFKEHHHRRNRSARADSRDNHRSARTT